MPDAPSLPVIVVPGTFWKDSAEWAATYAMDQRPMREIARVFGITPQLFDWSGANSAKERHAAARELAEGLASEVHLVGFSHGGNVAAEAAAQARGKVDTLVTIATPVTGNYQTGGARRHVHLYSPRDKMQVLGGEGPLGLPGLAEREFPGAVNIAIEGVEGEDLAGSHGNILWCEETWVKLAQWASLH